MAGRDTAERTKVLIIDDHVVIAEGLAMLIDAAPDLTVVGLAQTASAGLMLAAERAPDVVLLDHHLPDGDGAGITADLKALRPGLAVLVLTSDASDHVLLAVFEAGADGYLLKTKAAREVLQAIRHAASGETLITAGTLARVLRHQSDAARTRAERPHLTERERQVLRTMAEGLDTAAIARRLNVTIATARTYIQAVLDKLDAHSRLQAVVRARQLGLLG